jgi:hypothetical protein
LANGDTEDIYARLGKLERETANHGAILENLQLGQERLLKRSEQPTNWVGIGGLVFMVFGFLGSVMLFMTGTNKEAIQDLANELKTRTPLVYGLPEVVENNANWNKSLSERVRTAEQAVSSLHKADEWHEEWLKTHESQNDIERARNADIEERVSRTEGIVERLGTQVEQIDRNGSRRWNASPQ